MEPFGYGANFGAFSSTASFAAELSWLRRARLTATLPTATITAKDRATSKNPVVAPSEPVAGGRRRDGYHHESDGELLNEKRAASQLRKY
jgi:hypothetical protein